MSAKVLIVDDDKNICELLRLYLEKDGYATVIANDGDEAVKAFNAQEPDIILLDVMLPKLDGFTVLRRLRAAGNATPVLMLTARSELGDRVEGLDCGADYYLTKPFEPKELLACIRALTRRQPELRNTDMLEYGDLKLEKNSFTLSCGDHSLRLSR